MTKKECVQYVALCSRLQADTRAFGIDLKGVKTMRFYESKWDARSAALDMDLDMFYICSSPLGWYIADENMDPVKGE